MPDTLLSTILETISSASETASLQLPEDWMQGRAGYGGLAVALALRSMRGHVPAERKVRSLLTSFVGPVGPGDFSIHTRVLRSGKAVTQVEARLVQQKDVRCLAHTGAIHADGPCSGQYRYLGDGFRPSGPSVLYGESVVGVSLSGGQRGKWICP